MENNFREIALEKLLSCVTDEMRDKVNNTRFAEIITTQYVDIGDNLKTRYATDLNVFGENDHNIDVMSELLFEMFRKAGGENINIDINLISESNFVRRGVDARTGNYYFQVRYSIFYGDVR